MIFLFLLGGLLFSIRCHWLQIRKFPYCLRQTIFSSKNSASGSPGGITPFQALSTSLAATIGTGNLIGVATALIAGGPGALIWMWLSAFLGMATKYAEIVLSIHFRQRDREGRWRGGPMVYLAQLPFGKILATCYAFFCLFSSFSMGNLVQSRSISVACASIFPCSTLSCGLILAALLALILLGGLERTVKVTSTLVPVMAVGYLLGGMYFLILNRALLPQAIHDIFFSSLQFSSIAGGALGYTVLRSMRYGFARGLFSNEAGLGTAALAHSSAVTDSPVHEGMWGMLEVVIDTFLICTMTALILMTSGVYQPGVSMDAAVLMIQAFTNGFGGVGRYFLSLAIVLFAFSTLLGWSYYGVCCAEYLGGKKTRPYYFTVYLVIAVLGSVLQSNLIWTLCDLFNGFMAIPNLIGLLFFSKTVSHLTERHFAQKNYAAELAPPRSHSMLKTLLAKEK